MIPNLALFSAMYCFTNSAAFCKSNFLSPMCGFTAQLVEHRTGIAEVTGSNPVKALIFFRLLPSNCLIAWKFYCDDHSSLSSTTAVQYEFHIYFTSASVPLNESIISHVTFRDDHFHFYVPSFSTVQLKHLAACEVHTIKIVHCFFRKNAISASKERPTYN